LKSRKIKETEFYVPEFEEARDRIVIPFKFDQELVGYSNRFLDTRKPNYIHTKPANYLYNVDKQKQEWRVVLVMEGIFDAIISGDNSIPILGSTLSEHSKLFHEIVKNNTTSGTAWSFFYLSKVANSISATDAILIATCNPSAAGGGTTFLERTFHRKSNAILSGRVLASTAQITDKVAINNLPANIINDVTLSDYRFLIVASTYTGTSGGVTMQTNIILTKNPVV
jgi:hypothetical protein